MARPVSKAEPKPKPKPKPPPFKPNPRLMGDMERAVKPVTKKKG